MEVIQRMPTMRVDNPETKNPKAENSVQAMCGISKPVFQAAMAGLSGPDLVAAVSEAGGLGHLGALRVLPKTLRGWIHRTRSLTDKPFGVNLVPQFGGADFFEAALSIVLEERPKVLSLFYGDFQDVIPRAKDAGIVTMVQVGSLAEARKAVNDGADILIAQGIEAGGHVRGRVSLMALLPAVVDIAEGRPVIAAGAINDVRAAKAARCLGASGVWCGTAFLASTECDAHDAYKDKLVQADTDAPKFKTGYSYGWKYGTPHRAIDGKRGWNLLRLMGGGIRMIDNPKMADKLSLYAGQGVGQVRSIRSSADIVEEMSEAFSGPSGGSGGVEPVTSSHKGRPESSDELMHSIVQEHQFGVSEEILTQKFGRELFQKAAAITGGGCLPILDDDRLSELQNRFKIF